MGKENSGGSVPWQVCRVCSVCEARFEVLAQHDADPALCQSCSHIESQVSVRGVRYRLRDALASGDVSEADHLTRFLVAILRIDAHRKGGAK